MLIYLLFLLFSAHVTFSHPLETLHEDLGCVLRRVVPLGLGWEREGDGKDVWLRSALLHAGLEVLSGVPLPGPDNSTCARPFVPQWSSEGVVLAALVFDSGNVLDCEAQAAFQSVASADFMQDIRFVEIDAAFEPEAALALTSHVPVVILLKPGHSRKQLSSGRVAAERVLVAAVDLLWNTMAMGRRALSGWGRQESASVPLTPPTLPRSLRSWDQDALIHLHVAHEYHTDVGGTTDWSSMHDIANISRIPPAQDARNLLFHETKRFLCSMVPRASPTSQAPPSNSPLRRLDWTIIGELGKACSEVHNAMTESRAKMEALAKSDDWEHHGISVNQLVSRAMASKHARNLAGYLLWKKKEKGVVRRWKKKGGESGSNPPQTTSKRPFLQPSYLDASTCKEIALGIIRLAAEDPIASPLLPPHAQIDTPAINSTTHSSSNHNYNSVFTIPMPSQASASALRDALLLVAPQCHSAGVAKYDHSSESQPRLPPPPFPHKPRVGGVSGRATRAATNLILLVLLLSFVSSHFIRRLVVLVLGACHTTCGCIGLLPRTQKPVAVVDFHGRPIQQ